MTHGASRRHVRRLCAGHSLIELVTMVTVAGLLTSIGLPQLQGLMTRARLLDGSGALITDLAWARSESIKRGRWVTVCQSRDGRQCTGAASWQDGWLVLVDDDGSRTVQRPEDILRVAPPLAGATLEFNASGGGQRDSYLTYHPAGYTHKNGTFTLCTTGARPRARRIVVAFNGRVRSVSPGHQGAAAWCPPAAP